jgi:hypothetical protein
MSSRLESFSTEVMFEIFEYLSSINLFRAFVGLNDRLDTILNLYPLRLNLQRIFRSDLDFLCHHIQPKQVVSIVFSEEVMCDQVKLFLEYFPQFEHQFIRLQSVNFFKTENSILNLPQCVSSLTFKKCFLKFWTENRIGHTIVRQAKVLTHLDIDDERLIQPANLQLPLLTHLTINLFCFFDRLHEIIQCSKASLISLNVSIQTPNNNFPSNIDKMCENLMHLKHLTIAFSSGKMIFVYERSYCVFYFSDWSVI